MASRYLKAAIPTYEPGYVPLPLNFINEKIAGDQTKFDNAVAQVAALNALNQQVAPWDKGREVDLLGRYNPQIDELSNKLYETGQVGQVVPQIAKLQQQWQNDPLRKELQTGYDWYTTTELARQKEKGYADAYNELKDDQGNWKTGINNYQLQSYKYVPWDQDKYLQDNLNNWMASSYAELTGADNAEITMVNGVPMIKETRQGKTETKFIDPDDPTYGKFYKNAINALTDQVMSGDFDAATWLKGKKGADRQQIYSYIENLAKQKYFRQSDMSPGATNYSQVSGSGDGSNKPIGDFTAIVNSIPLGTVTGDNYNQINKNISNLDGQMEVVKNSYQTISATTLKQFPKLKEYVESNIQKGLDPNSAINEGFGLAVQYAETLPKTSPEYLAMQGSLADMNKAVTDYNILQSKKFVFEQQRQFVDDKINNKLATDENVVTDISKLDNTTFYKVQTINGQYNKNNAIFGFDKIKPEDRGKFMNLLVARNKAPYGKDMGLIEDQLFDMLTGGKGIKMDNPTSWDVGKYLNEAYRRIESKMTDPAIFDGIKFDGKGLFISNVGQSDTKTEQWNDALQANYKNTNMSMDLIARNAGFSSDQEMLNSAVAHTGKIGKPQDYKFGSIQMIQFGSTPTALYTFVSSKEGSNSTVQVVAPLTTVNNNKTVQESSIEMYNKGISQGDNALASSAAQLLVTSSLDETEYGKLLFMFKANTNDYKPLTFNIQGANATLSKSGGAYIIDVGGVKAPPVYKEEDVLTVLGMSIMDQIQTQAFGTSGGGSNGMGKGTTWVPQ